MYTHSLRIYCFYHQATHDPSPGVSPESPQLGTDTCALICPFRVLFFFFLYHSFILCLRFVLISFFFHSVFVQSFCVSLSALCRRVCDVCFLRSLVTWNAYPCALVKWNIVSMDCLSWDWRHVSPRHHAKVQSSVGRGGDLFASCYLKHLHWSTLDFCTCASVCHYCL